jgi:hypothetical protein
MFPSSDMEEVSLHVLDWFKKNEKSAEDVADFAAAFLTSFFVANKFPEAIVLEILEAIKAEYKFHIEEEKDESI